jgi:hypothetical protein
MTDEQFWSQVNKLPGDDACWLWTGKFNEKTGVAQVRYEGKAVLIHRRALTLAGRPPTTNVRFCPHDRRCLRVGSGHLTTVDDPVAVQARFWSKVNKNGPTVAHMPTNCWLWTSAVVPVTGYGSFTLIGNKRVDVHVYSWQLHNGTIPNDLWVLHHCDVKLCLRPNHLYLGTPKDNSRDMMARGQIATGERNGKHTHPESTPRGDQHWAHLHPECILRGIANPSAKLTEDQVRQIRAEFTAIPRQPDGRLKYGALAPIARQFNVDPALITRIGLGKVWRHVK